MTPTETTAGRILLAQFEGYTILVAGEGISEMLPDYAASLDDLHRIEQKLSDEQWEKYHMELDMQFVALKVRFGDRTRAIVTAPASVRFAALVRVLRGEGK